MQPQQFKMRHVLGSVLALGIASALVLPTRTEAFSTIGGSLGLAQRDFRVFNNFTDANANDNVTPDANFPGYVGVAMAIWKADIEWASRLHANGNGDPTQPNGLGSGGANFDPSWQGFASDIGATNENIVSEISGSSGATLAFTETPISDGWRIRVYADAAVWNDGPGSIGGGQFDIQGVLCHEFGHTLGLGHSTVNGATMAASVSSPATGSRSINSDDIAGIQSVYGVATVNKPIITSIFVQPGLLTINGSNFDASSNDVWFTQVGIGGSGSPVIATGIPSPSGMALTVSVPMTAGPGDVFVRIPGSGNDRLSNPWPFLPDMGPVCPPTFNTCFTSPNSVNAVGAVMGHAGTQSIANNNFVLLASGCPPNASGIFYFGANETFSTFGNGFRCIGNPTFRLGILQVNLFGDAVHNLNIPTAPGGISAGQTKFFQFWYRNPAGGGAGFNLSDALGVPFCP